MSNAGQLAEALDAVVDGLEPPVRSQSSAGRRRRGRSAADAEGEAVLQVVERDGVLHVEEAEPGKPMRRPRRGIGTVAAVEEVKYERKFDRLDRSQIGSWLERLDTKRTPKRGLRVLGDGGLEPLGVAPRDGRILLLIHGTFSESESFLTGFGENPRGPDFIDWAREPSSRPRPPPSTRPWRWSPDSPPKAGSATTGR